MAYLISGEKLALIFLWVLGYDHHMVSRLTFSPEIRSENICIE